MRGGLQVCAAGMKEMRDRIASVKNTQKITEVGSPLDNMWGPLANWAAEHAHDL